MNKHKLRGLLLDRRSHLSDDLRFSFSQSVIQSLHATLASQRIDVLLAYHSVGAEVDTRTLHQHTGKLKVFAPVCGENASMRWRSSTTEHWQTSAHGTPEPAEGLFWQASPDHRCAVACPLLGFDRSGNRLGMGAGYFDRWLAIHGQQMILRLGLAFSCQEVPHIPAEPHDQPLDMIITEKEIIACQNT